MSLALGTVASGASLRRLIDTPGERELSTFPAREGHIQLRRRDERATG